MKTAVKIEKSLCQRAEHAAAEGGLQFARRVYRARDREGARPLRRQRIQKEDVLRKLKGLGYIE